MDARERLALAALAAVLAVTASWWALALWPLPGDAPSWMVRTRAVCFGAAPDGFPDAGGWLALIGQPLLMLGTLRVVAGGTLGAGLRKLVDTVPGFVAVAGGAALLVSPVALLGWRIADAGAAAPAEAMYLAPGEHPRLDHAAPSLDLVDQAGERVSVDRFRGRPLLVTFAYAHCETVCPSIVRDVLDAQREIGHEPVVIVVTLDPWRDTPARLPRIARAWRLGDDAHVLTGAVEEVRSVLDAWRVPWDRDPFTGEVTHPALVYVVDRDGRVAFATTSGAQAIAQLVRRVDEDGRR